MSVEDEKLESLSHLKEGDCLIAFSKKKLCALKNRINGVMNSESGDQTNHCAMIYGTLPPESKIEQTNLFNERRENVKFLLATDAIGMGLNLNINRIIFTTLQKPSNRRKLLPLTRSQIQQIAGRAGRFTNHGRVTSLNFKDLKVIKQNI